MTIQSWLEEKAKIELRIAEGAPQPTLGPTVLPLRDIQVIPEVFQHRSGNLAASDGHVNELVKSLKASKGKPFEAVTVFWIGDAWVAVDGHHRLEAYSQTNHLAAIPVAIFKGTLDEAIGEALKGNARDKLAMGSQEKSNGAWRLVISTGLSINKMAAASTRSRETIITMKKAKDAILKNRPEVDLGDLSWREARMMAKGLEPEEQTYDEEWLEKEAQALANALVTTFGHRLGKQPEVLWRALDIYDAKLTDRFLERYGIDSETLEKLGMDF